MTADLQQELEQAIQSGCSLPGIVALLRRHKALGATQAEVYALLTRLREGAADEAIEDRIVEVADFVAGFCSPHMRIWDE